MILKQMNKMEKQMNKQLNNDKKGRRKKQMERKTEQNSVIIWRMKNDEIEKKMANKRRKIVSKIRFRVH